MEAARKLRDDGMEVEELAPNKWRAKIQPMIIPPHTKVFRDGNKWIALLGTDIQSGTAGTGDTQEEALAALEENRAKLTGGEKIADRLRARGLTILSVGPNAWQTGDLVFDAANLEIFADVLAQRSKE